VNDDYHNTLTEIVDGCVTSVGVADAEAAQGGVQVYPNPFTVSTVLRFRNPARTPLTLEVLDLAGRTVRTETVTGTSHTFERRGLASGTYVYRLFGDGFGGTTGRFDVQ
jgi:hypothetical protein